MKTKIAFKNNRDNAKAQELNKLGCDYFNKNKFKDAFTMFQEAFQCCSLDFVMRETFKQNRINS